MKHIIKLKTFILIANLLIFTPFIALSSETNEYINMSLKDILSIKVSSALKKKQLLKDTAAAVFVITSEDIKRSGVTTIADALRMAPGLNVAQINMNQWAITSRGFNAGSANKLLVLIDGQSVYNPLFSGVYWSEIDTLLSDIDRIEVIRGPAGSLWGVNAVNGIINIITKKTIDTQGGLLRASIGHGDKLIESLRYGGAIKDLGFGRVFFKHSKRGNSKNIFKNTDTKNNWVSFRGGMRLDLDLGSNDSLLIKSNVHQDNINQQINIFKPTFPFSSNTIDHVTDKGWSLLSRWEHHFYNKDSISLQGYVSSVDRQDSYIGFNLTTFDIEFQNNVSIGSFNEVTWGVGVRNNQLLTRNTFNMQVNSMPPKNITTNFFIQDNIQIIPNKLALILGSKVEFISHSETAIQPNIRLKYTTKDSSIIWVAVSKASRSPTYFEHYGRLIRGVANAKPTFLTVVGNKNSVSENLTAYEIGYRTKIKDMATLNTTIFYNKYYNLVSFEPINPITNQFGNNVKGESFGLEIDSDLQILNWWQIRLAYSLLQVKTTAKTNSKDLTSANAWRGSSPKHEISLRSMMNIGKSFNLDFWGRYTGKVNYPNDRAVFLFPTKKVKGYFNLDAKMTYDVSKHTQLSFTARNLLHKNNLEFIQEINVLPLNIGRYYNLTLEMSF